MERENLIKTGTNGNEKVRARFTLKLCEPSYDGFARSLRIWVLTTFWGGYFISLLRKLHGSFASVQEGEHSSPASLSCGICNRQMLHRNHEDRITDIILHFPKHPPHPHCSICSMCLGHCMVQRSEHSSHLRARWPSTRMKALYSDLMRTAP